jgi:hypothetical protein
MKQFEMFDSDGQQCRVQDDGHAAGYLHCYDHFYTPGALYPLRRLQVLVPRNYDIESCNYPVLFMNDGDTIFFPGGLVGQCWEVANTLLDLYAAKAIVPLIVVAIWPVNRNKEYTHVPWYSEDCCAVEEYAKFVSKCLKPFIDDHYRTLRGREHNMILGSSHGGLAAFYIANRFPDVFGYAGSLSPSFWVGLDDATKFPVVVPRKDLSLRSSALISSFHDILGDSQRRPKHYIDWGLIRSGGPHNSYIEERATARGREMVALLQSDYGYVSDIELSFVEDPRGDHREESWGRRMPHVLKWFAER